MFDFIFNYIAFLPFVFLLFIFLLFVFFVIFLRRKEIIDSLEHSFDFTVGLSMAIIIGCCITILTEFLMLVGLNGVSSGSVVTVVSGTTESFNVYIYVVALSLFFIWFVNFIYKYLSK